MVSNVVESRRKLAHLEVCTHGPALRRHNGQASVGLGTSLAGALLGAMVTLTSVGAGALGATLLLALYPLRMRLQKLIATDIVHAVPLTLVAGLGHLFIGNFNLLLLLNLLAGSIPGIIIGSMLASKVPEKMLQPLLACVLVIAGWRLLG